MDTQTVKQNLVYIGIAVIIFLLLSLVRPTNAFTVTGIILPAEKTTLIPSSKPVQLFQTNQMLATPVAYINVEAHSLQPSPDQQTAMITAAKSMAQQAGADGLVITAFGYEGPGNGNPAPLAKYVLYGTAIKTN